MEPLSQGCACTYIIASERTNLRIVAIWQDYCWWLLLLLSFLRKDILGLRHIEITRLWPIPQTFHRLNNLRFIFIIAPSLHLLLRLLSMCAHTDNLKETVFIELVLWCGRYIVIGQFFIFELIRGKCRLLCMSTSFWNLVARILISHHVMCSICVIVGFYLWSCPIWLVRAL